jgi:formamidopyrimidine-DNA glycosylase
VPELPEVETVRRDIEPAMRGARIERVLLRRANLRRPFPLDLAGRVAGTTVRAVTRRGKYLLGDLSSGETLLMHLGMSGSIRVESGQVEPEPHDHVVFEMSSGATVIFNDPRRFGVLDLVPSAEIDRRPPLSALGPEPLSAAFDGPALAHACRGRRVALKVALLDQRVVAGLGNIYASEALSLARLSPRQRAARIATPSGQPRDSAGRLAAAIKRVLERAIVRQSGRGYRGAAFRVYDRAGERCPNRGCGGVIRRMTQAGRSTFYCPTCQQLAR